MNKELQNDYQNIYRTQQAGAVDKLAAESVSSWISSAIEAGTNMLPKTHKEMLEIFALGKSILVYNGLLEPIGHAAITQEYINCVEIGAMVTRPDYRRKGVGTKALQAVLEIARNKFPGKKLFALANNQSGALFEKLGASVLTSEELDPEVWSLCANCPAKPATIPGESFKCCDTPYDLTDILINE